MGKHHGGRGGVRATEGRTLNHLSDRALVESFTVTRDEDSFRALYGRHTPMLYAVASRIAGDQSEDLVQDTWIRASERLDSFRWESSLRTWLVAIMLNCFRERVRHTQRDAATPMLDDPHDPRWVEPGQRLDLERAIAALPPGYREVFVLHDIEGYLHGEIAAMLGISEGTCKSQLSRARAALRKLLDSREQSKVNHDRDG